MSKSMKLFLCFIVLLTGVAFGPLIAMGLTFSEVLSQPLGIALFTLGCLAPALSTVLTYVLDKTKGGLPQLWKDITAQTKKTTWLMMIYFLVLHYGLAFLMGFVADLGTFGDFLKALPIMFVLFGTQELGWRLMLQPALESYRGFWKGNIALGMIISLWFLPLIYIPGFYFRADMYLVLAIYLVGVTLMQSTLRNQGGSILTAAVFSTLHYSMLAIFSLVQSSNLMVLLLIDGLMAFTFKSKIFKENRKEQGLTKR